MINTWEELRTRRQRCFVDPFPDAFEGKTEDECAEILDGLLSVEYGEDVRIHRYELAQKRKAAEIERRRQACLDSNPEQKPPLVKRVKNWFHKKR